MVGFFFYKHNHFSNSPPDPSFQACNLSDGKPIQPPTSRKHHQVENYWHLRHALEKDYPSKTNALEASFVFLSVPLCSKIKRPTRKWTKASEAIRMRFTAGWSKLLYAENDPKTPGSPAHEGVK